MISQEISTETKVIIFGTGQASVKEYEHLLSLCSITLLGFVDNDTSKQDTIFLGLPVLPPKELPQIDFDKIVIASMHAEEITRQLVNALTIPLEKIDYSFVAFKQIIAEHCKTRNFTVAKQLAYRASKKYGLDATLSFNADIFWSEGEWASAAQIYQEILLNNNSDTPAPTYFRLAFAYRRNLDLDEAENIATQGLDRFPDDIALVIQLAEVHLAREQWQTGIDLYRTVLERQGANAPASTYTRLAFAYRRQLDWSEAEIIAKQGLEHFPEDVGLSIQLAEAYLAREQWQVGSTLYRTILERQGADAPASTYFRLAFAYRRNLDLDDAEAIACQGMERFPDDNNLLIEFAWLATRRGHWNIAADRWLSALNNATPEYKDGIYHCLSFAITRANNPTKLADMSLKTAHFKDSSLDTSVWKNIFYRCLELTSKGDTSSLVNEVEVLFKERLLPPHDWWMALTYYLFCRGHFDAAYRLKEFAISVALNVELPYPVDRFDYFAALIETYSMQEALNYLLSEVENSKGRQREICKLYQQLANHYFLSNHTKEAFDIWQNKNINEHDKYYFNSTFEEIIQDKTVAIVGGASTDLLCGEEIDEFDVVIRTNYSGNILDKATYKKIGAKTSISYYNSLYPLEHLEKLKEISQMDALKALVLFDSEDVHAHLQHSGATIPTKSSMAYRGLFKGCPYAAQRIVLDIVRYKPKKIKVFNCDFFIGKDLRYKGYTAPMNNRSEIEFLMIHDPLRNFQHTKKLFDIAKAETDKCLAEILKMDEDQFLDAVCRRHFGQPRQ